MNSYYLMLMVAKALNILSFTAQFWNNIIREKVCTYHTGSDSGFGLHSIIKMYAGCYSSLINVMGVMNILE